MERYYLGHGFPPHPPHPPTPHSSCHPPLLLTRLSVKALCIHMERYYLGLVSEQSNLVSESTGLVSQSAVLVSES